MGASEPVSLARQGELSRERARDRFATRMRPMLKPPVSPLSSRPFALAYLCLILSRLASLPCRFSLLSLL